MFILVGLAAKLISVKEIVYLGSVFIEKVKVLPWLGTDLTDISPSKTSQIVLQIFRPNPIPLVLMLELARNLPKT
jgi:hypothetical protein